MSRAKKKWIQDMHMKKGALHRDLNVKAGEKIPEAKLEKATHSKNPTIRKRAALAETLKSFRPKKAGGCVSRRKTMEK